MFLLKQNLCGGNFNYKFIIVNCYREASLNLNRYSEAIIYTNISGNMGVSDDSFFNGILLENIDKGILQSYSLLTTPVKYTTAITPSISKTDSISNLENYIDENYVEAAKTQLK